MMTTNPREKTRVRYTYWKRLYLDVSKGNLTLVETVVSLSALLLGLGLLDQDLLSLAYSTKVTLAKLIDKQPFSTYLILLGLCQLLFGSIHKDWIPRLSRVTLYVIGTLTWVYVLYLLIQKTEYGFIGPISIIILFNIWLTYRNIIAKPGSYV
jgi:hypothetical protein